MGSATPPTSALSPQQIQAAYGINLLSQEGAGQTIAIIDAYDDPNLVSSSNAAYATSDLHNFDAYYGLPDFGGSGPTFTKLDQNGGTNYPGTQSPGDQQLGGRRGAGRGVGPRHRAAGQHRTDRGQQRFLRRLDRNGCPYGPQPARSLGGFHEFLRRGFFDRIAL